VSRPRFLAVDDLNEQIVDGVARREPAVEFRRVRHVGLAASPDADVLAYAADHGLMVVSHDVNTMPARTYDRLVAGRPVAGLLMVRETEMVGAIIESLVLIWSSSELEEWACGVPSALKRMALRTGEADVREGDYYGSAINR